MGNQTTGTVFDSRLCIGKITAAAVTQRVKRTIAKNATERIYVCAAMAGKIFTSSILKKIIMGHIQAS